MTQNEKLKQLHKDLTLFCLCVPKEVMQLIDVVNDDIVGITRELVRKYMNLPPERAEMLIGYVSSCAQFLQNEMRVKQ